ncbi:MAG: 2-C-methyl-D-erythritol 4-phosphate cytidylyltransferase [Gemmatimonadota bacterium]
MNATARLYGLIPAAGSGTRVGGGIPKQYIALGATSMLEHSIDALAADARVSEILVVVAPDDERHRALAPKAGVRFAARGGASRAASVRNGLQALGASGEDWVLVHDAARPCLARIDLARLIDAALADDVGGLLALPLADTLKREREGRVETTVARDALWRAQTPQMFRCGVLMRALDAADLDSVTDESSAIERLGLKPRLVQGSASNIKVTTGDDWPLANAILKEQGRIA